MKLTLKLYVVFCIFCIFVIGFVAGTLTYEIVSAQEDDSPTTSLSFEQDSNICNIEKECADEEDSEQRSLPGQVIPRTTSPQEVASPSDRITEDQIHVYNSRIIIDLENAEWASFTDTNSMDPVIDAGSNAIEIIPKVPEDIHIGDIVSYESEYADGVIIHRVIQIGNDDGGWYAVMKGDNNPEKDPGKIRFSQIRRVVVAIIY